MTNIQKTTSNNLKKIGLNSSETKVYLFLLEFGSSSPSKISKETSILRTNCYGILDKLEKVGLVSIQTENKKRKYIANNPNKLLDILEEKKNMIKDSLLPDLHSLFKSQKNKPVIKFFEGKEGIKEIFEETYEAEAIYGITSTDKLFKEFGPFLSSWRKNLVKKGIFLKDILTYSSKKVTDDETQKDLGVYFEHKIIPKEVDLNVDILVWNDKVAIFTIEEPFFGTLINNNDIAKAFVIMHKIMWSGLGR